MSTEPKKHTLLTKTLLWFGYLGSLIAWCWLALCYGKDIINSNFVAQFINTEGSNPTINLDAPEIAIPQAIINFIGIFIALIVIGFVVMAIALTPKGTQTIGEKATQSSADILAPIIAKNYKLDSSQKRSLHVSIVWIFRLILSFLPLILVAILGAKGSFIPYDYMIAGATLPAIWASIFFSWVLGIDLHKKSRAVDPQN
ncbi:hypothetical protein EOL73_02430 [Candidatus Saccharibacteria bacterium]|nr:hypothetical protein [Candidatus Saccharibacteria bacterium]NCU40592.1 hypothetical protein [Candidatus Saccharibacteria bacterium]